MVSTKSSRSSASSSSLGRPFSSAAPCWRCSPSMAIWASTLIVTLAAVVEAVASLAGLAGAAVAVPYRVLRRRRDGLAALPAPEQLPPTPIAAHWTAAWRAPDQALPSVVFWLAHDGRPRRLLLSRPAPPSGLCGCTPPIKGVSPCGQQSFSSTAPSPSPRAGTVSSTRSRTRATLSSPQPTPCGGSLRMRPRSATWSTPSTAPSCSLATPTAAW